jgi:hypothetical protein
MRKCIERTLTSSFLYVKIALGTLSSASLKRFLNCEAVLPGNAVEWLFFLLRITNVV